jgi:sugar lactone lactonase YvrE
LATVALCACSDADDPAQPAASSSAAGQGGAGGGADTGGSSVTGGSSSAGGSVNGLEFVAKLDSPPEGLAVRSSAAWVGLAATGEVLRVDLSTGEVTPFGTVDGIDFLLGLEVDADGNVYAAAASLLPGKSGVYRIDAAGGAATLFGSHPELTVPNDLARDDLGNSYVSDSAGGSVFRIDADGVTAKWVAHETLAGEFDFCEPLGIGTPFPFGANGVGISDGIVYVVNTEKASVVRIPIEADGSAAAPSVLVQDCDLLAGSDGIEVDADGSLIVAVNNSDRLARVQLDGTAALLVEGAPLESPASLAIHDGGSGRELIITNYPDETATGEAGVLRYALSAP